MRHQLACEVLRTSAGTSGCASALGPRAIVYVAAFSALHFCWPPFVCLFIFPCATAPGPRAFLSLRAFCPLCGALPSCISFPVFSRRGAWSSRREFSKNSFFASCLARLQKWSIDSRSESEGFQSRNVVLCWWC